MTIIPISGQKLRKIIQSRGLTMTDLSRSTGYNPNYISECVHNNSISRAAAKIIENEYGISVSDYLPEPEPVKPEPVKREPEQMSLATWFDYDALRDAIRDGVVAAWEIIKGRAEQ